MAKKEESLPTKTTWHLTEDDLKKMLKEHLGLVDGSLKVAFPSVFGSDQTSVPFMVVTHEHPPRTVRELEGPNPNATKELKLSKGGKY